MAPSTGSRIPSLGAEDVFRRAVEVVDPLRRCPRDRKAEAVCFEGAYGSRRQVAVE